MSFDNKSGQNFDTPDKSSEGSQYSSTAKFISSSNISNSKGLLKLNKFIVHILPPNCPLVNFNSEKLTFNALSAQNSGINVDIGDTILYSLHRYYYKVRSDADLAITFLESGDLNMRRLFDDWIACGYDVKHVTRPYYFEDVKSPKIEIIPLLPEDETMFADVYEDAIPTSVNDINYDVGQSSYHKTTVTFKFVKHYIEAASV